MADDSAGQAVEIIGALQEAGLLRATRSTSNPAAQIISALSEAGLLQAPTGTGGTAAPGRAIAEAGVVAPSTPQPPPLPAPKVGDEAFLGGIRRVTRSYGSPGGQVFLVNDSPPQWVGNYALDFPPNDVGLLPGFDAILAAPRELRVHAIAAVKITKVSGPGSYQGKLTLLRADWPWPLG